MSQKTKARIELPPKLVPLFTPKRGDLRHRNSYGGRGSTKSFSFAKMAAIWGYAEKLRILCTREIQNSIKESFHAELKNAIQSEPWLEDFYDVGIDYIRGKNGTEFIFKGLRHNLTSVKSLAQIDLCIVEEAEDIPESSWQVLEPTIRSPRSEIWSIWNPKVRGSPVDKRFRQEPPPRSMTVEMNWRDNPWFPPELEEQRKHAQKVMDSATYMHIWEGEYLERSDAQVFHNWRVEEFKTPRTATFRFGADWGFAVDPTVLIRAFIEGRKLYIDYEAYAIGCEIMDTPDLFMTVPESEKWPIIADSARPETISHMQRNGFPKIMSAIKGAKSVEDGIEWLKSFEIIVHPRCENVIKELTCYNYKIDKLTGDVLPVLEDKDNHCVVAGTKVDVLGGYKNIEDVIEGDKVLTRNGYRNVSFSGVTDVNRDIVTVRTTEGELMCTPDHKIFTVNKGFVRADALRYNDEIVISRESSCQKQSNLMGINIGAIQNLKDGLIGFISKDHVGIRQAGFIGMFGLKNMAIFQKAVISTIKMKIRSIMTSQTLSVLRQSNMQMSMNGQMTGKRSSANYLRESGHLQRNGTQVKKVLRSIEKLARLPIRILSRIKRAVSTVQISSPQRSLAALISSAPTSVNLHGEENQALITRSERAHNAEKNLHATNTVSRKHVHGHVLTVTEAGKADKVYDITVDDDHEFFANGILVHNCIDALRYACEGARRAQKQNSKPLQYKNRYVV